MKNVYLPIDNVNDFACYSVLDKDTIRAYSTRPQINTSSNYVDFYINSHYLEKEGTQSFGSYSPYLPECISSDAITTDFYYRNDMSQILIMFIILCIFIFYIPIKVFLRLFRRFQ